MKKIWKYEVGRDGQVATLEGTFARILAVKSQGERIYVWIEYDESAPNVSVDVIPFGTGWELPDELLAGMNYIDTVVDGPYVWHYYWRLTPEATNEEITVETPEEENKEEETE